MQLLEGFPHQVKKKCSLSNLEQFYCSMPLIEFERYWSQIVLKVFNKIFSSGLITTLDM